MPCSYCHERGHNRRTCPELNNLIGDPADVGQLPIPPPEQIPVQPIPPPYPIDPEQIPIDQPILNQTSELKKITLYNMRNENYLLYWVIGDWTLYNLDETENEIQYIDILLAKSQLEICMKVGHRFHLIPTSSHNNPRFHPPTDQKFWTDPYVTINFYQREINEIHIDDKDNLSELNQWKFTALKLDYLMKELIKLGGKNVDTLEPILDLHQDIILATHDEFDKDRAGIPSAFTNVT